MNRSLDLHLGRWLVDLHAVEQQAIFQLGGARRLLAGTPLAEDLQRHLDETRRHRAAVRARLAARGRHPSPALDVAVTANRAGFLLYTAIVRDAPGKLLADSYAYEFLEIAAYGMLAHAAERAGDDATRAMALEILADERTMAERLSAALDWAVEASRRRARSEIAASVRAHLRDAHALETQTAVLLGLGSAVAGTEALAANLRGELGRTRSQRRRIAARLRELGTRPSALKSAGLALGGAGWSLLWAAQRYTPAKLACFLYAARHLEIASYELLRREALLAGDRETESLAAALLAEEQAAARDLAGRLAAAADAALAVSSRAG